MSTKHTLTKDEFETMVAYWQTSLAVMATEALAENFIERFDGDVEIERDAAILHEAYRRELAARRPLDSRVRIVDVDIEADLGARLYDQDYYLMKPVNQAAYGLYTVCPMPRSALKKRWENKTLGKVERIVTELESMSNA